MLIIVGSMIPSAILFPQSSFVPHVVSLNSSWQIPAVLLSSMICGPQTGFIASFAYLTIGLFYLPVFHGGGSIGYILTPEFGYLLGFIPASLVTGKLARKFPKNQLIGLTVTAITGILIIHIIGILNLFIGNIIYRWQANLLELFIAYSLAPIPAQLILCPSISIISIALKRILLIK